ncbi:hypothetical protein D3C81_2094010 [compost metagenome]
MTPPAAEKPITKAKTITTYMLGYRQTVSKVMKEIKVYSIRKVVDLNLFFTSPAVMNTHINEPIV